MLFVEPIRSTFFCPMAFLSPILPIIKAIPPFNLSLSVKNSCLQPRHPLLIFAANTHQNHPNSDNNPPKNNTPHQEPLQSSPSPKHRLLQILATLINLDSQRGQVEALILQLEALNAIPLTPAFTEMALSGHWRLLFSSMRTRTDGAIRIRQIGQIFDTQHKTLTNQVLWSFPSVDGSQQIMAYLWVISAYQFHGAGRLRVQLREHKVKILQRQDGEKNKMPGDLQALITKLQLALPIEFFDPSGLLDVTYIEPDFRLARFMGKRLAGVRNVFVRSAAESKDQSES